MNDARHGTAPSGGVLRESRRAWRRRSTTAALGLITTACIALGPGVGDGAHAAGVEMEQTSPDHLLPGKRRHDRRREQYMFGSPGPVPRADLPRTLYRVRIPVSQVGEWSGRGSSLCQTGRLGVREEGRYVVQARGGALDVAWGDGRNLRDPTDYARDGKVYMFFMHGTSACRVYVR